MKVFNFYNTLKVLAILFTLTLAQPVLAQVKDSVSVDSLSQSQQKTPKRPRSRGFIIGSVNSSVILQQMPQYKAMKRNLEALRDQYEAEARKSEEDFQRKFEEFMQGQKEFPKTILEKRQNELQNMLETNSKFRIKVQQLLIEAEKSLKADVMAELNDAITIAAEEKGISLVFDLDNGSIPYMVSGLTVNLNTAVLEILSIEENAE